MANTFGILEGERRLLAALEDIVKYYEGGRLRAGMIFMIPIKHKWSWDNYHDEINSFLLNFGLTTELQPNNLTVKLIST